MLLIYLPAVGISRTIGSAGCSWVFHPSRLFINILLHSSILNLEIGTGVAPIATGLRETDIVRFREFIADQLQPRFTGVERRFIAFMKEEIAGRLFLSRANTNLFGQPDVILIHEISSGLTP